MYNEHKEQNVTMTFKVQVQGHNANAFTSPYLAKYRSLGVEFEMNKNHRE